MATQYAKGGSPVADYTDVGNLGMSLYAAQAARNDASHKELMGAVELSNKALTESKKHMMSLPSDVGAVYAEKIEQALEARSKAIMSGGSAVTVSPSIQEFQDLSIGAAKLSAVNIDLVNKFEKMRQSEEYLENKEVYDKWYENSQGIITETAKGDITAVSQLDFFQPPIKKQELNVVADMTPRFHKSFSPANYMKPDGKGSHFFNELMAKDYALSYVKGQYDMDGQDATDIDLMAVLRIDKDQTPAQSYESVLKYKGIEDALSVKGKDGGPITTIQQIDALEILASEKRELKSGLAFLKSREEVMSEISLELARTAHQPNQIATKSTGSEFTPPKEFAENSGTLQAMGINPDAAKALNLNTEVTYGEASTRGARLLTAGGAKNEVKFRSIIFDGKNYYGVGYKPTPDAFAAMEDENLSVADRNAMMANPVNRVTEIVSLKTVSGAIVKEDLPGMLSVAKDAYEKAIRQDKADAQAAEDLELNQIQNTEMSSVSLKRDGIPGE